MAIWTGNKKSSQVYRGNNLVKSIFKGENSVYSDHIVHIDETETIIHTKTHKKKEEVKSNGILCSPHDRIVIQYEYIPKWATEKTLDVTMYISVDEGLTEKEFFRLSKTIGAGEKLTYDLVLDIPEDVSPDRYGKIHLYFTLICNASNATTSESFACSIKKYMKTEYKITQATEIIEE